MKKVPSVRQPWAELIVRGEKTIELRHWDTKFRGEFYVHASKTIEKDACKEFGMEPDSLVTGALVGKATLTDVKEYRTKEDCTSDGNLHKAEGLYGFERPLFGFVLQDAERMRPIPAKGRLGFFETSLEELPVTHDGHYRRCIELAEKKSGFGAILDVDFADGTSHTFEGRSQRKRPGRYASGGYCEHAENVVVNDAVEHAELRDTKIARARMYIAGFNDGDPYIYEAPRYACVMCAAQMRKALPGNTEILLPMRNDWVAINPTEAYDSALSVRKSKKSAGDFRKGNNSLLHTVR